MFKSVFVDICYHGAAALLCCRCCPYVAMVLTCPPSAQVVVLPDYAVAMQELQTANRDILDVPAPARARGLQDRSPYM